jgi:hypothetical protein
MKRSMSSRLTFHPRPHDSDFSPDGMWDCTVTPGFGDKDHTDFAAITLGHLLANIADVFGIPRTSFSAEVREIKRYGTTRVR